MSVASIEEFKANWKALTSLFRGRPPVRDRIEAALFGYSEEEWQAISALAKTITCENHGKCHGAEQSCIICGDVSRTCQLDDGDCAVHRDAIRCGKKIATALGFVRCSRRPAEHQCSGIQEEWFVQRELLRAP